MSRTKGKQYESNAKAFLIGRGLEWVAENYVSPFGEIDLIFNDEDCLVFVEVRMRKGVGFGGALESITLAKQRKILKTAEHYLLSMGEYDLRPCRLDVILIDDNGKIEWMCDAFSA